MTETLPIWDREAHVIVIGYGFAGGTAAITAQAECFAFQRIAGRNAAAEAPWQRTEASLLAAE